MCIFICVCVLFGEGFIDFFGLVLNLEFFILSFFEIDYISVYYFWFNIVFEIELYVNKVSRI